MVYPVQFSSLMNRTSRSGPTLAESSDRVLLIYWVPPDPGRNCLFFLPQRSRNSSLEIWKKIHAPLFLFPPNGRGWFKALSRFGRCSERIGLKERERRLVHSPHGGGRACHPRAYTAGRSRRRSPRRKGNDAIESRFSIDWCELAALFPVPATCLMKFLTHCWTL